MAEAKRYNIYYHKYNIFGRGYGKYIRVVFTDDIYREIGKLICNSLESIRNVRYTQPKADREACEILWIEGGYRKITDYLWAYGEKVEEEDLEAECARVVRCKNCKFAEEIESEKDMNFFKCPWSSDARDANEFCSRGVIREDVDAE